MYKPVRLDARDRAVRLGAQGKAEQQLGGAERRLGGSEWRLGRAGEAAELCGAAELLGVPLTEVLEVFFRRCTNFMQGLHLYMVP